MADSENSRTLPAFARGKIRSPTERRENIPRLIDRRNLLAVASRFLSSRIDDPDAPQREPGPTPVREMWPKWHALYQQQSGVTRFRKKLESELLEEAGGSPAVELRISGETKPVIVQTPAEINQLASRLDVDQLSRAKAELSQRRKRWKETDERLGYSAALALEKDLMQTIGISARVMWITPPSSLIEVAAKLHCVIVMHDPGLKLQDAPWPQLRTILKDLVRMHGKAS